MLLLPPGGFLRLLRRHNVERRRAFPRRVKVVSAVNFRHWTRSRARSRTRLTILFTNFLWRTRGLSQTFLFFHLIILLFKRFPVFGSVCGQLSIGIFVQV